MEACHAVDIHITACPEAETVFTGLIYRYGKRLVDRIHLGGEIGYLQPLVLAVIGSFHNEGGVAAAAHHRSQSVAFCLPGREHQFLTGLDLQRRRHQILDAVAAAATHHGRHIETRRCLLGNTVLHFPAFGKPAVRHLAIIEPLIHLLGRNRLSLHAHSHEQEQCGKE